MLEHFDRLAHGCLSLSRKSVFGIQGLFFHDHTDQELPCTNMLAHHCLKLLTHNNLVTIPHLFHIVAQLVQILLLYQIQNDQDMVHLNNDHHPFLNKIYPFLHMPDLVFF